MEEGPQVSCLYVLTCNSPPSARASLPVTYQINQITTSANSTIGQCPASHCPTFSNNLSSTTMRVEPSGHAGNCP